MCGEFHSRSGFAVCLYEHTLPGDDGFPDVLCVTVGLLMPNVSLAGRSKGEDRGVGMCDICLENDNSV